MIGKLRSLFRAKDLDGEARKAFLAELMFTNFRRARVFTPVLLAVFALLVISDIIVFGTIIITSPFHTLLFITHATVTGVLLLLLAPMYFRPPGQAGEMKVSHRIAVRVMEALVIAAGIAIGLADQGISNQITPYVLAAFGLGALFLLGHAESVIIYGASTLIFAVGVSQLQAAPAVRYGNMVNGLVLSIVA